jgi:PAS domain S-box-containing protein
MLHQLYDTFSPGMNALSAQTLAAAASITLLGAFALLRERGSRVGFSFFLLALSMGEWLFGSSRMYNATNPVTALHWARVANIGVCFLPGAVFNFSAHILQRQKQLKTRRLVIWLLSFFFSVLLVGTDLFIPSVHQYSWGYSPRLTAMSIPFFLFFSGTMFLALRDYAAGFRASMRKRNSIRYKRYRVLLVSFAIGYLGALDFLASFGIPFYPFGYVTVFLFTLIAGYAILRYRFLSITPAFAAGQIIDTMSEGLIVLDPEDGMVVLVNTATCALFDWREEDVVGKRLTDSITNQPAFAQKLETAIRSGSGSNIELEYQTGKNIQRTVSFSISTMRSRTGEPLAFVCIVNDITARKRSEEEREQLIARLQEANEMLKSLDTMKSNFISTVSHELRTPLTTIKALIELLILKKGMTEERKMMMKKTINSETDRLARLVTDLLDLARIESGSMKWQASEVLIEQLIRDVIAGMVPLFESKKLTVTTDFASLPRVPADQDLLVQVITNILSNAVKFTPEGGRIHVAVRLEGSPASQVVVEISDSGIGIPGDDLERIFEKFHRANHGPGAAIEGTGLGLAISRQIVERHGGRIWATSTEGKGSTFTFTLPLA